MNESFAQVELHTHFNDPMLTSLIDHAFVDNQELKILAEDIQIARNHVYKQRGAYGKSLEIKREQLAALEASVDVATKLFQALGRVGYVDVLLAQRDMQDAKMVIIETKKQQLTAVVDFYQALGDGMMMMQASNSGTAVVAP